MTDPIQAVVLVLENDEPIRVLTEAVLELSRFEVHTATSIEDAAALLHDLVPDVVVLDLELPGRGSDEAFAALRGPGHDGLRVIGIAGADQVVDETTAIDALLRKPRALHQLPPMLTALLSRADDEDTGARIEIAVGDRLFVHEAGDAIGLVRAVGKGGIIASVRGEDVVLAHRAIAAAHHGKVLIDLTALGDDTREALGRA